MKKLLLASALLLSTPALAVDYVSGPLPGGAYAGHGLIGIQTFCLSGCTTTSTGAYTPDAGTNQVIIEVQAAGGGSGSCALTSSGQACVGGSASGGSYARGKFTASFSGITMTIGAAGTAGSVSAGGVGGTTSAGSLISCPGGLGGLQGTVGTQTTYQEAEGPVASPSACTQTGGVAILSVAGPASSAGFQGSTGAGGQYPGGSNCTPLGCGPVMAQLAGSVATSTGATGVGYGWGAGGSLNDASQAATLGAAGGPSIIIVYEYN